MRKELTVLNSGGTINVEQVSVICPYCHQSQIPEMYRAYECKSIYYIFCACVNSKCGVAFVLMYNPYINQLDNVPQADYKKSEFSKIINTLSFNFCEIYNQAYSAEQMQLSQITGVGYRKALEFLIKDYLISKEPDKANEIKRKPLGKCINDDITDANIREVSKRAAWLGNDETHYVRKWEDKDITHLKGLIDLCVHWIEAELNTQKILEEMPE